MCNHTGVLRKEHPGVALSVKTHHATRSVLNHCRDTVKQLLGGGLLDEPDAELILMVQLVTTRIVIKMSYILASFSSCVVMTFLYCYERFVYLYVKVLKF